MGEKKPKVCKCGHSRDLHVKYKKLSIPTNCQTCPCTDYMNRKRPDLSDKAFVVVGIILCGFLSITITMLFVSFPDEVLNKQIHIPVKDVFLFAGLSTLFIIVNWFSTMIMPYFRAKNRKAYPEAV